MSLFEILLFIFWTAVITLLPKNLFWSLSLNSWASNAPVDAPEGDIAVAEEPSSKKISASTVGLPLLSNTCRPLTLLILPFFYLTNLPISVNFFNNTFTSFNGTIFGPSDGALSGSSCVSIKIAPTPTAIVAR